MPKNILKKLNIQVKEKCKDSIIKLKLMGQMPSDCDDIPKEKLFANEQKFEKESFMDTEMIILYQGTDSLTIIGLDRTIIRGTINRPYTEFTKSAFSINSTDDYKLFHVFYDENNICEAIEFFNDCPLILENTQIIGITSDEIKNIVLKKDANLIEDEYGLVSKKLSLGISCPNGAVETVVIGKKGYYDDLY